MATLTNLIRTTLEADSVLTTALTGGIFDASELDYTGEGAHDAPKEADGVQIKPHMIIRWGASVPTGANYRIGAEDENFECHIYQDSGYDVIGSMVNRVNALLHDKYFTPDDRALAHVTRIYVSGELPAEELGYVSRKFMRFSAIHIRK
jgi:hypothetical protein